MSHDLGNNRIGKKIFSWKQKLLNSKWLFDDCCLFSLNGFKYEFSSKSPSPLNFWTCAFKTISFHLTDHSNITSSCF